MNASDDRAPPTCFICGNERTRLILDQPSARYFPRRIFRCSQCAVAFVFPRPSADVLRRLYSDQVYFEEHRGGGRKDPGSERARIRVRLLRRFLTRDDSRHSPLHVLEVGPGNGEFLSEVRRNGWEIEGLELSPVRASALSAQSGVRVFAADSLAAIPDTVPYDVIAMWEVIEHYTDPLSEARAAFARLARGGILALSTPNDGSLRARVYRERWRGFREGWEHLFFFSSQSLRTLLKRAGFSRVRFITRKINSFLLKPLECFGMGNALEAYAWKSADSLEARG